MVRYEGSPANTGMDPQEPIMRAARPRAVRRQPVPGAPAQARNSPAAASRSSRCSNRSAPAPVPSPGKSRPSRSTAGTGPPARPALPEVVRRPAPARRRSVSIAVPCPSGGERDTLERRAENRIGSRASNTHDRCRRPGAARTEPDACAFPRRRRAQLTSANARPEGTLALAVDQVTEAVAALEFGKNTALNQHLSGVCRFLARGEGHRTLHVRQRELRE